MTDEKETPRICPRTTWNASSAEAFGIAASLNKRG